MVVNQLATCSNTRECVIVLSRPTPQFTHGDNFSQHTGVGKIVGLKKNCQACGVLEKNCFSLHSARFNARNNTPTIQFFCGLKKNCQACGVLEKIVTPGFNKKNYRCLTISIF